MFTQTLATDQPVTDRHHYQIRPEALVAQQGLKRLVTKAATSIGIPDAQCMVYLPKFTIQIEQSIPGIEHLGMSFM